MASAGEIVLLEPDAATTTRTWLQSKGFSTYCTKPLAFLDSESIFKKYLQHYKLEFPFPESFRVWCYLVAGLLRISPQISSWNKPQIRRALEGVGEEITSDVMTLEVINSVTRA